MASSKPNNRRLKTVFLFYFFSFLLVIARLFYWQVIKAEALKNQAQSQTIERDTVQGKRGKVYSADGHLLVGNQTVYNLYINKREIEKEQIEIVNIITPIVADNELNFLTDDNANDDKDINDEIKQNLFNRLDSDSAWVLLANKLAPQYKQQIEQRQIIGLHFIEDDIRSYPEGSMAAHLTGFVGKDQNNQNIGYFGLEGALDKELQKRQKKLTYKRDAKGTTLADQKLDFTNLDGRSVTLSIRRDLQYIVETSLAQGIKDYQSSAGEVVVMDPATGEIMALATWPHYDPQHYHQYQTGDYKNPCLTSLYEPGSTFKTLTVAAGIDSGVISPETVCTNCDGPRTIGGYTIKTWNEEYHPGITVKEALRKSDNIAMINVAEKIGAELFLDYLQKFGIGQPLNIDLQEDSYTPIPNRLGPVELATSSFGQGISANSMQIVRAIATIANRGLMMRSTLVKEVYDPHTGEKINYESQIVRRVISSEAAQTVTDMMIYAAPDRSEWIAQNFTVAGKTGTSQIPSEDGGYNEEGTIASYVGFAPANDPQFVMLVKLTEPKVSQWGATTAVPIWYDIANKVMMRL